LILSAKRSVVSTVENLGDPVIMNAFMTVAKRGVGVRIIVPMCDKNPIPTYNYQFFGALAAGKVNVRVMPFPATATQPYMHSKMILVDNTYAYVGSVNFSVNSTQHARELGIIFGIQNFSNQISRIFEQDWSQSVVPGAPPTQCPVVD
jgi:phosphatidylserine/phosphatidylglycerophosphate/cardiolipin synthase-like enzyme